MLDTIGLITVPTIIERNRRSVALDYLRAFVILLVVAHHAVTSYAVFSHFDIQNYLASSEPIVDPRRWVGFDVFLLFTDVFFMPLMFLLSGLFVWPSLRRHGAAGFLRQRWLRLGVPYAVALLLLMPPAYYPSWRMAGGAPGLAAYWWHTVSTGPRPNGPIWFIGVLLLFDTAVATLHRLWPDWSRGAANLVGRQAARPTLLFTTVLAASIAAYLPLLLRFGPDRWLVVGPVLIQADRVLLYAVQFGAGIAIGRAGGPLLAAGGALARQWRRWLLAGAVSFAIVLAWNTMALHSGIRPGGGAVSGVVFALACCAIGFACFALFLRFARQRFALADSLAANAYGIFLVHYVPMVWLQYGLLAADLPAGAKAALVLAGTLGASWAAVAAARRIPAVRALL